MHSLSTLCGKWSYEEAVSIGWRVVIRRFLHGAITVFGNFIREFVVQNWLKKSGFQRRNPASFRGISTEVCYSLKFDLNWTVINIKLYDLLPNLTLFVVGYTRIYWNKLWKNKKWYRISNSGYAPYYTDHVGLCYYACIMMN